jgi:hypothetical protein
MPGRPRVLDLLRDLCGDPYAVLEKLRGKSAVFYAEKLGYLVLTRVAEVAEVFR